MMFKANPHPLCNHDTIKLCFLQQKQRRTMDVFKKFIIDETFLKKKIHNIDYNNPLCIYNI
jgi:hypothetical protein